MERLSFFKKPQSPILRIIGIDFLFSFSFAPHTLYGKQNNICNQIQLFDVNLSRSFPFFRLSKISNQHRHTHHHSNKIATRLWAYNNNQQIRWTNEWTNSMPQKESFFIHVIPFVAVVAYYAVAVSCVVTSCAAERTRETYWYKYCIMYTQRKWMIAVQRARNSNYL